MEIEARVEAFVRAPSLDAFDVFVEPARLTAFWLAKASAPLTLGARVKWEFLVPGASDEIEVTGFERGKTISIRWSNGSATTWTFTERTLGGAAGTVIRVTQRGFGGTDGEQAAAAIEATQGFTLVLADCKLLLEHGKAMGLVRDKASLIVGA